MRDWAEGLLRRSRTTTLVALSLLTLLAWAWIATGAGLSNMSPDMAGMVMPTRWDAPHLLLMLAMWWVMMVAMMTPAAAPTVLLYVRAASTRGSASGHAGFFLAGYFLAWLSYSFVAVCLQAALEGRGLVDPMQMRITGRAMTGLVLLAAGLYQLSPWKGACLRRCRNPAELIARYYRPGALGALRMGIRHGSYCVGCCWLLMALLFVGGVMNMAWIAALSVLVALEKLHPKGRWIATVGGVVSVASGAWLFISA